MSGYLSSILAALSNLFFQVPQLKCHLSLLKLDSQEEQLKKLHSRLGLRAMFPVVAPIHLRQSPLEKFTVWIIGWNHHNL
jgi:hypothetical protein